MERIYKYISEGMGAPEVKIKTRPMTLTRFEAMANERGIKLTPFSYEDKDEIEVETYANVKIISAINFYQDPLEVKVTRSDSFSKLYIPYLVREGAIIFFDESDLDQFQKTNEINASALKIIVPLLKNGNVVFLRGGFRNR